jgi:hypothetical protein
MQTIVAIERAQGMPKISSRNGEGGSRYYEAHPTRGIHQCSQITRMARMTSNHFLRLKDIGGMGDVVHPVIHLSAGQQIDVRSFKW